MGKIIKGTKQSTNPMLFKGKKIISMKRDSDSKKLTLLKKHTGTYRMALGTSPALVKDGDSSDRHRHVPVIIYGRANNGTNWTQQYHGVTSLLVGYRDGTHTVASGFPINDLDRIRITIAFHPNNYHGGGAWPANGYTFTKASASFPSTDVSGNGMKYSIQFNSDDTFDVRLTVYTPSMGTTASGTYIQSIEYL